MTGNSAVASSYEGTSRGWGDSAIGLSFLADLVHVNTFITNAKYDMVVSTPAIALALASYTSTVASAVIDTTARTGIDRPGWIKVTYAPGVIPAPATREIRFPSYSNAGHTASIRDPAHLLADVMQWYAATPAASSPALAGRPADGISTISRAAQAGPAGQPVPLFIGP